jgi:hypothetical protein
LSTADIAVIAMAGLGALQMGLSHRVQMRVADRLRLVNPVKEAAPSRDDVAEQAATQPVKPAVVPEIGAGAA